MSETFPAAPAFDVTAPPGFATGEGVLYRIEGTGIKIVGTAHAFTLDKPLVPAWLRSVVERSDQLIFEMNFEAMDPAAELLGTNQSLTVLSFFDLIAASWQRLQMPGRAARFKAWAASARLSAALSGQAAPGVELLLLPEAKRENLPPQYLDTPEERVAAFDAVPLDEQLARLEHLVTQPEEAIAFETAVYAAWQAQNIDAISRLLDSHRKTYPETFARLLDDRNKKWLPTLREAIHHSTMTDRSVTTLVALEATHLCGEQGIVALLTAEGCKLTRLL